MTRLVCPRLDTHFWPTLCSPSPPPPRLWIWLSMCFHWKLGNMGSNQIFVAPNKNATISTKGRFYVWNPSSSKSFIFFIWSHDYSPILINLRKTNRLNVRIIQSAAGFCQCERNVLFFGRFWRKAFIQRLSWTKFCIQYFMVKRPSQSSLLCKPTYFLSIITSRNPFNFNRRPTYHLIVAEEIIHPWRKFDAYLP